MSKRDEEETKQITDQSKDKVLLEAPKERKLLVDVASKNPKIVHFGIRKSLKRTHAEKLEESKKKSAGSSKDEHSR
jgi:hypothetical protein